VTAQRIELGRHVLDKEIHDVHGRPCGKVDDLLIEFDAGDAHVVGLVTGPTAFARAIGPRCAAVIAAVERLLGLEDPRPVDLTWSTVEYVDVGVHLNVAEEETGANQLARVVSRRFISRLPGA
jgi:sporulation protein YlmC with PRC-barrel domain